MDRAHREVKRARAAAGTAGVIVSATVCTDMHNSKMRLVGTRVECALMVQPGDRVGVFIRGTEGEVQWPWKGRSGELQTPKLILNELLCCLVTTPGRRM